MLRPDIVAPQTLAAAIRALRRPGAVPLAGATDLIPALRKGELRPKILVNLKGIPELVGVRGVRGGLRVGALTTVADLLEEEAIAAAAPLLAEVAKDFGSPQIRSVATIGGNLCNATPSADFGPPLLALDARVEIRGTATREVPLSEFFTGPNKTILRRGEVMTAVIVPKPKPRTGAAQEKLTTRRAMDLAIAAVCAAVSLRPDGETCAQARIALGAVAPTPRRVEEAEAVLVGKRLTPELIREAAAGAAKAARPVTDLRASAEYRRDMVVVLTERALAEALRRAKQEAAR